MTLVNHNAYSIEAVCLITLADSSENACKLSNHWSTFDERVDDENWVDLEIRKMKPLANHVVYGLRSLEFSVCLILLHIRKNVPRNCWPLSCASYCTCYATVRFRLRSCS